MLRFSIEPRDGMFVNIYVLLYLVKKVGGDISKHLSDKYIGKRLDHAKHFFATDNIKYKYKYIYIYVCIYIYIYIYI